MKILEFMSFDPSWFLTPSGLLITGGVVLLLVALIVFIATSKKDKGNANVDPTVDGSIPLVDGPTVDMNQMAQMNQMGQMPVNDMSMNGVMNNQPVNNMNNMGNMNGMVNQVVQPQMVPSMEMSQEPVVAMPTVPEVNPEIVQMPSVNMNNIPVVDPMFNMGNPMEQVNAVPTVEPVIPVSNLEVTPVGVDNMNVQSTPVMDFNNVTPVAPVTVETPVMNNNIYGGSNPAEFNSRPIYGGANPLENTASIPTVSHSAYNGAPVIPNSVVEEVKIVEPTPINQFNPANEAAVVNNQQTVPITAADIFNQAPVTVTPTVEIQQPTPIVEPVAPTPTIVEPTPISFANEVNDSNAIETLDF